MLRMYKESFIRIIIIYIFRKRKINTFGYCYRWEKMSFELRAVDQPYHLLIEIYAPYYNSSVGVDNIRLLNCFPGN